MIDNIISRLDTDKSCVRSRRLMKCYEFNLLYCNLSAKADGGNRQPITAPIKFKRQLNIVAGTCCVMKVGDRTKQQDGQL